MNLAETSAHRLPTGSAGTLEPRKPFITRMPTEVASPNVSEAPSRSYVEVFRDAAFLVAESLERFELQLRAQLTASDSRLNTMLLHVAELGGKRLRPSLLFLSAKSFGNVNEEAIRLAMVVELVHTATLVHDDILDGATLRRHKPTLHVKWDVPASVLVGDWLFTHAYRLANEGESTIPGRWVADAAKHVCCGEIAQGQSMGHFELSETDYLNLLEAKTGALCGVSCALGAWSSGASMERCERFRAFGAKLGTAFQVYDDWLDVWGETSAAGKTLGTDLCHLKPTLPMIRALSQLGDSARNRLVAISQMDPEMAMDAFRTMLGECDAREFTLSRANELALDACSELESFEQNGAIAALIELARAAVHRNS